MWTRRTQARSLGALADAALSRQLAEIEFKACTRPAAAPLARLLGGGALKTLAWVHTVIPHEMLGVLYPAEDAMFLDAAGAVLVADALRASTTLTLLYLEGSRLCADFNAAQALLAAVVNHRSLRMLQLTRERPADPVALGGALAAIVAADSPQLTFLFVADNALGDAGLAPIVDALHRNHHMDALVISDNGMTEEFARERLLPALRAATNLRILGCTDEHSGPTAALAQNLVNSRR